VVHGPSGVHVLMLGGSSWVRENKYRNQLNIDTDLRVKISSVQPNLNEIINKKKTRLIKLENQCNN